MSLDAVQVFVHVVQAGSFTAAARRLGMPRSTVSLRVAELEKRLGAALLHRTTRSVRTTETGAAYFTAAARALSELSAAEQDAARAHEEPRGTLRIAGKGTGAGLVGDLAGRFLQAHPQISVDLRLLDRQVDLLAEHIDVAFHFGPLDDDAGVIGRKIGMSRRKLLASPDYLCSRPPIRHPRDLSGHELLCHTGRKEMLLVNEGGARFRVAVAGRFSANQISALQYQAIAGRGIAELPLGMVAEDLRRGALVDALPGWSSETYPIHIVYPKQRFVPRKVRAFVDFVAKAVAEGSCPEAAALGERRKAALRAIGAGGEAPEPRA